MLAAVVAWLWCAAAECLSPLAVETTVGRSTVVIQGVLHGSSSSASDVTLALNERKPDVILLELCAPRWRSINSKSNATSVYEDLRRVWATTKKAGRERGPGAAASAAAIGWLYAVSKVAGFDPGIEFRIPLDFAKAHGVDVVLGDRDLLDTLSLFSGERADFNKGLGTLSSAAFGVGGDSLRLLPVLASNPNRLVEFATLMAVLLSFNAFVGFGIENMLLYAPSSFGSNDVPRLADFALASSLVYFLGGTIGAKVIDARDEILARSTRDALRIAKARQNSEAAVVLVVVGALHVNGILKRLNDYDTEMSSVSGQEASVASR